MSSFAPGSTFIVKRVKPHYVRMSVILQRSLILLGDLCQTVLARFLPLHSFIFGYIEWVCFPTKKKSDVGEQSSPLKTPKTSPSETWSEIHSNLSHYGFFFSSSSLLLKGREGNVHVYLHIKRRIILQWDCITGHNLCSVSRWGQSCSRCDKIMCDPCLDQINIL